jgi:alpha-L-fucosidase
MAQDDPSNTNERGNARDAAAVKEAEDGWWTQALKTRDDRLEWWRDARFGCFMHWGVYAVPAGEWNGRNTGGYSEHIMRQAKIPLEIYKRDVVSKFDPQQFNADEWVTLIKNAGMQYLVITAKHHDGFAMYPSDAYPYDIRLTPFKRDPMKELSEACKKQGVRFGFYYSHAFDWEHPDAPGNDWDYNNPGGDKKLHGAERWYDQHPELLEKAKHYVDQKAIPQLLELVNRYHPDIFWFDTSGKLPLSEQIRIVKAVRLVDPNVVINGRAARGMGKNFGDYLDTADNPAEVRATAGDWEAIPTVNNSYGYHKLDKNYKSPEFFIQLLAKIAAKGGNMLLNTGPMADGHIDPKSQEIFRGIAKWWTVNGESIRGTQRTPLDRQAWGDSTLKGDTLYLHVFDWPRDGKLIVGGLQSDVSSAYLLADASKSPLVPSRLNPNDLLVQLPPQSPDSTDSVVVLKLNGEMKASPGRLLATNVTTNRLLAFDAIAGSKIITYGDGKAARYYATGFKQSTDTLTWKIRTNEPASFNVIVKYSTNSTQQPGAYNLKVNDKVQPVPMKPTTNPRDMQTVELGKVDLVPGDGQIVFGPANENVGDPINLFEILLTPITN